MSEESAIKRERAYVVDYLRTLADGLALLTSESAVAKAEAYSYAAALSANVRETAARPKFSVAGRAIELS